MTRRISVLGATGSIGDSTLDIIARSEPGEFKIVSLTANSNAQKLAALAIKFNADFVACLLYTSPSPRDGLLSRMPSSA